MNLMQLTCKELGEANNYITDIAQKTVRERLAEVLLLLKDRFDMDENQILKISLTREELANLVGTATESVIRLLSEFKSDKLIELQGRKIKILNEKGYDHATIKVYLYKSDSGDKETIQNIKAITYNSPNEKTILTEEHIFTTSLDDRYDEVTFTFPNL